jgi:hypothetical protein
MMQTLPDSLGDMSYSWASIGLLRGCSYTPTSEVTFGTSAKYQ